MICSPGDRVLPVVPWVRVLVPGTTASLRPDREDLAPGDRVVVVYRHPGESAARIGALATVTAARTYGFGGTMLDVVGECLVARRSEGTETAVDPVDGAPDAAPLLVRRARQELRRYMAARAEAGKGGDVHVDLPDDPVAASHRVASLLEVTWPELQDVLEAGDAAARLEREIRVLARETGLLRAVLARTGTT